MNVSQLHKIVYIVAIVILLVPLVLLSAPATNKDGKRHPGGVLPQLRYKHQLSQANLGDIDPASEAMRMASLGLRGVAANLLWSKAFHYQKVEDFDALRATLNQITNLQPNFISVWEFQAHNLSYNIAVEFDDYRYRYHWIKKGIDFLIQGTMYNRDEPKLLWNIGWYLAHKMGRADEHKSYRRLFREDKEFHEELDRPYIEVDGPDALGPQGLPDNWLVGRLWFREGERVVDTKGAPLRGKSPLIFHSHAPMCRINYAGEIEKEGYLDEKAQLAWQKAGEDWGSYGNRQIPTSWGVNIRLNDLEQAIAEEKELEKQLDELAPGVRDELKKKKIAELPELHRQALETPAAERSPEQTGLAMDAGFTTTIPHRDVAANAPEAARAEARLLARRVDEKKETRRRITQYRNIINYSYWKTRCEVEQTKTAVKARSLVNKADKLWEDASFDAKDLYEQAWREWAKIMEQYPVLRNDVASEDLVAAIMRYRSVIEQLGEDWPPADFALADMLRQRAEAGDSDLADFLKSETKPPSDAPPNDKPDSSPGEDPAKPDAVQKPNDAPKAAPADNKPSDSGDAADDKDDSTSSKDGATTSKDDSTSSKDGTADEGGAKQTDEQDKDESENKTDVEQQTEAGEDD